MGRALVALNGRYKDIAPNRDAAFLVSDEAAFVTGVVLEVDGRRTIEAFAHGGSDGNSEARFSAPAWLSKRSVTFDRSIRRHNTARGGGPDPLVKRIHHRAPQSGPVTSKARASPTPKRRNPLRPWFGGRRATGP